MNSNTSSRSVKELHFIVVNNGVVVEVSKEFADMTEFRAQELLNKNIEDVFTTLRIGPEVNYGYIDEAVEYFLFTKSLEVRFVDIYVKENTYGEVLVFSEKPNSRLNMKFLALEALSSHNVFGVAIFSMPDITLLKANQTWLNFLDKPFNNKENSIGKRISEFIAGWSGSTSEDIWKNVLSTQKPFYSDEYMYEFVRGVTYWQTSLTPVFENGILKYCIEITTDITEKVLDRKRVEEQAKIIEEQNKQLRRQAYLLDLSYEAVFAWKLDGGITYWNKGAVQQYGYSSEEAMGCVSHDLLKTIHPKPFDNIRSALLREGVWSGNIKHTRKDGSKLIVETRHQLVVDEHGHQIVLESNRDITEKVRQEEELGKQKELLETMLENIQEYIYVFDREEKYIIASKKAREDFSVKSNKTEAVDRKIQYYDLDGEAVAIEKTPICRVKKGETVRGEVLAFKLEDKLNYTVTSGTPIHDEEGNFLYGVINSLNITELMTSQQELKETQDKLLAAEREKNDALEKAIEMKDEFLSIISHEFRTPLNIINMAIQTLNLVYPHQMTDSVKKYVGTIKQNTNRQLRLVNNLLDITRVNAGSIKVNKKNIDIVFLTKAIAESVCEFALQKEIKLTFKSSIGKKIIGIDDEKYERIVLNLLSNAIKFTPMGKYINVSLRLLKGNICVEVKDCGIGIPLEKLDVIFERFGQVDSSLSRQAEGTGIGLALVKRFVEALDGSISVKSKVGIGTTFTIMFPDETIIEDYSGKSIIDFMNDSRLVQATNIEFSDIYL